MKKFILLMFVSLMFTFQGIANENFKVETAQFEYLFDSDGGIEFISINDLKVADINSLELFSDAENVKNEAQIKDNIYTQTSFIDYLENYDLFKNIEPFDYSENRYLINDVAENYTNFRPELIVNSQFDFAYNKLLMYSLGK